MYNLNYSIRHVTCDFEYILYTQSGYHLGILNCIYFSEFHYNTFLNKLKF